MKITFAHLGNTYLSAKALFDGLGVDYILPPFNSKSALEIGSRYSPEEICLPFKIMMGNYIESIERGADTVIITGSCGPCRFGEYCEMQMNLLKKLGYPLEFIVIDSPGDIGKDEFLRRLSRVASDSNKNIAGKFKALYDAYTVTKLVDDLEAKVRYMAGFEKVRGSCKILWNQCKEDLLKCASPQEMIHTLRERKKKLLLNDFDRNKKPLKVAIIGEIYTIIEPFSNLYIEDKLMDYGVSTKRTLSPSWWFKNMVLTPLGLNTLDIKKASKKYLPFGVGGHGKECIGEAVIAQKEGFDGAIQIFPMGCMPEIVSKSILPTISKDKNFPIMTLVVDEMTGEAGYVTRIEAFLDLLERRQQNVLSGS